VERESKKNWMKGDRGGGEQKAERLSGEGPVRNLTWEDYNEGVKERLPSLRRLEKAIEERNQKWGQNSRSGKGGESKSCGRRKI